MNGLTRVGRAGGTMGGLALAALLALAATPGEANVGVASVVNGEPVSQPPQESQRVLHIGNAMTADEVVTTRHNDRAHIVFLDGSTLTVGPDSTVTIDKFVFDPGRQNGTLSLNTGRGVFRYVGGAISKNAEVTIRTPSSTVGIRGGIATVTVEPSGATRANFLFGGSLSMTSQGVTQVTTQPSTQVAALTGLPPTPPGPIPPGTLQQTTRALSAAGGPGGAAGGPAGAPSAAAISLGFSGSSFSQANSGLPPATARAAIGATQQAQLGVGKALAAAAAAAQGGGPTQAAGPLQGGGPVQGGTPLQGAGPLQASGPTQGAGPMQNAGPLAASSPLQQTGPVGSTSPLALGGLQPGLATPEMPVQQAALGPAPAAAGTPGLVAGLAAGDGAALQQLQNLLATPQGTSPATLGTLVSGITSAAAAPTASTGPGAAPSAPPPLAPTVYNSTASRQLSPN